MHHSRDRSRPARPVLGIAAWALLACGGPVAPEWTDRYELASIDGFALPVELPTQRVLPADSVIGPVIRSGAFELRSDGSCRRTIVADVPADLLGSELENHESWWNCTWTEEAETLSLTWVGASDSAIPLVTPEVVVTRVHGRLELAFETGIICVRAPCPTGWSERYERLEETVG